MALTQGKLGLTVREIQSPKVEGIPTTKKDAQKWLEALPVADIGESGSKLFHYMYDLNGSSLEPKVRLSILEVIRPFSSQLVESLSEIYIHSPLKQSRKFKSASELVHALASEQIFGFNAVIEDINADSELLEKYSNNVLAAACAGALNNQGLVQLQRYQLYKTIGSKVWQQQNIIYKLAHSHLFFDEKLKKGAANLVSVKNQLLLNLSLNLSNPYQMRHGEINQTYSALVHLADLIEISNELNSETRFAFTADSNIPPQPSNAIEASSLQWQGLNLSAAVQAIEKSTMADGKGLLSHFKKNIPIELEEELKAHILVNWNSSKSRNFIRINSEDSTKVTIGLAASHHFLVEKAGEELKDKFFGKLKKKASFQGAGLHMELEQEDSQHGFVWGDKNNMVGRTTKPSNDAFASIYTPRTQEAWKEQKENQPFEEIKTKKRIYEWTNGLIKDVSPAGFCIAFDSAPSSYVESNEIISIQNYKNGEVFYNLGLIRWNRWHNNETFLIGVELISSEATPVRATLDWDYAKPSYHHNGLLLPEMQNVGVDSSLILPPLGYRSGQTVAIMTPEQEYKVELTKKIIQTDNFIQFHYCAKD